MRQINLLKQIYFIVLSMVLVSPTVSKAQTLVFAQLTGNPVNTTGWNLTGATYVGDTGGDANNSNDEVILTNSTFH